MDTIEEQGLFVENGQGQGRQTLERLLAAHEAYFDVCRDYEFAGHVFAGYAEFHSEASGYVLVKRAKLWEATAHEYLFFELVEHLDEASFEALIVLMTERALEKVEPSSTHMSSYLSLVVIADTVDPVVRAAARKTRWRKNFKLGLEGWADLRVAVVDLGAGGIVCNARGKELRSTLEANAF